MACRKCRSWYTLFYGNNRQTRITAFDGILFHQRLYLYIDFLPVPDIRNEEQMLYKLQNLRLGTFYDVHSNGICGEFLLSVIIPYGNGGNTSLGVFLAEISWAILVGFKSDFALCQLPWKNLPNKKGCTKQPCKLISPHSTVCETGYIFWFFKLADEIALVVETALMSDFLHGIIGKPQ